jgi:hypothetical protein
VWTQRSNRGKGAVSQAIRVLHDRSGNGKSAMLRRYQVGDDRPTCFYAPFLNLKYIYQLI